MTSQLSILSDAMALIGQKAPQDLTPEALGVVGKKVYARLDDARQNVLVRSGWIDALSYDTLQPAADLSNWKFGTCYVLPKGALRVWEIDALPGALRWTAGTITDTEGATRRVVWTNGSGALNLSWVRDAKAEALGPALGKAVAHELAALTCFDVTENLARSDALIKLAAEKLAEAIGVDAMQEGGEDPLIPDTARMARAGAL